MTEHLEKTKLAVDEICEFKKQIFEKTKAWHNSCADNIDAKEFGEMIDVIKDLAETEKLCWEAAYYKAVTMAMAEGEEDLPEELRRAGYNHNHYRSSGRFASAGHGTRMGYPMLEPEMWRYVAPERFGYPMRTTHEGGHSGWGNVETGYGENGMPGYTPGSKGTSRGGSMMPGSSGTVYGSSGSYGYPHDPEYGRAYNQYRESRRHYTETKDYDHKKEMDHHAEEHLKHSIHTLREIWKDVDPEMRKKMKTDLQGLVGELN